MSRSERRILNRGISDIGSRGEVLTEKRAEKCGHPGCACGCGRDPVSRRIDNKRRRRDGWRAIREQYEAVQE